MKNEWLDRLIEKRIARVTDLFSYPCIKNIPVTTEGDTITVDKIVTLEEGYYVITDVPDDLPYSYGMLSDRFYFKDNIAKVNSDYDSFGAKPITCNVSIHKINMKKCYYNSNFIDELVESEKTTQIVSLLHNVTNLTDSKNLNEQEEVDVRIDYIIFYLIKKEKIEDFNAFVDHFGMDKLGFLLEKQIDASDKIKEDRFLYKKNIESTWDKKICIVGFLYECTKTLNVSDITEQDKAYLKPISGKDGLEKYGIEMDNIDTEE